MCIRDRAWWTNSSWTQKQKNLINVVSLSTASSSQELLPCQLFAYFMRVCGIIRGYCGVARGMWWWLLRLTCVGRLFSFFSCGRPSAFLPGGMTWKTVSRRRFFISPSIYFEVYIYFIKSWKTSAVSTTVWMVETQLCKLRGYIRRVRIIWFLWTKPTIWLLMHFYTKYRPRVFYVLSL